MNAAVRIACALALAAAAATPLRAQEPERLKRSEIRALFKNNEMTATNPNGLSFTEVYSSDGTFKASSKRRDGSCCATDVGRWAVEGNMLCKQYSVWQGGQLRCSYITKDAQGYSTGSGMRMTFKRN